MEYALYEEVPFLFRQELKEPRVYQSILAALAGGAHKFGEISSKTGLDRAHLTSYLGILNDLGLVRREVPITEVDPAKSRKGRYVIVDPFIRSWYRFVYANLSRLEMGDADGVLRDRVSPTLHQYVSRHVEEPVATLFGRGRFRELVPFEAAFVGRHWSPTEEFDLVVLDSGRRRALVGEVKWSEAPVPTSLAGDLVRRVESCQALRGVDVTLALVSRTGFRGKAPGGTLLVDLQG